MTPDRLIRFDAIAAADSVSDFGVCGYCGWAFEAPDSKGDIVEQHQDLFMLCKKCRDAKQNLRSEMEEGT